MSYLQPAAGLRQPWVAFAVVKLPLVGHGFSVERNWMPQFRAAYARLAALPPPVAAAAPEISDLPLQEVHAAGPAQEFALLLTGDGGWAGLDQDSRHGWPPMACRRWH